MSASQPPMTQSIVPESPHSETSAQFMRWALTALGMSVAEEQNALVVQLDPAGELAFDGKTSLRLVADQQAQAPAEAWSWQGRFGDWLAKRLQEPTSLLHAQPAGGPISVTEISGRLFKPYRVEGGQVHLAGCQLTDHPFARLSFYSPEEGNVRHLFVAPDGSTVSQELARQLGLDRLEPLKEPPASLEETTVRALVAAGRRIAAKQSTSRAPEAVAAEPLAVTLVWVRHAEGRLQFTIGKTSAIVRFLGWASLVESPPLIAPGSGVSTYHVAATDDGRIDAAAEIARCDESGRRVLRQELVECCVTAKRVLAELTENCPVLGLPALRHEFVVCPCCLQRVSRAALIGEICRACSHQDPIRKDDPRLLWLFGDYRGLERWSRWRLAETEKVYVAVASGWTRQLLVVLNKETLAIQRLATAGRWRSSDWLDVPEAGQKAYLQ